MAEAKEGLPESVREQVAKKEKEIGGGRLAEVVRSIAREKLHAAKSQLRVEAEAKTLRLAKMEL